MTIYTQEKPCHLCDSLTESFRVLTASLHCAQQHSHVGPQGTSEDLCRWCASTPLKVLSCSSCTEADLDVSDRLFWQPDDKTDAAARRRHLSSLTSETVHILNCLPTFHIRMSHRQCASQLLCSLLPFCTIIIYDSIPDSAASNWLSCIRNGQTISGARMKPSRESAR